MGLRPGVRYQTRDEFFARSSTFHSIPRFEWVTVRRLALEPGTVGVFVRDSGEMIVVRYENDIRG